MLINMPARIVELRDCIFFIVRSVVHRLILWYASAPVQLTLCITYVHALVIRPLDAASDLHNGFGIYSNAQASDM